MTQTMAFADIAETVDDALGALDLPAQPAGLYDPVRYVLGGGGKRVRPALVVLAAEAWGGAEARARALPAALAVETFHNFTLVHDDIMDHAATRRGRPTVHERWDVPTAVLAGDLMMGLSYQLLGQTEGADVARLLASFSRMVAALCEGQTLDLAFETRADVTVDDYLDMIDRKTGALLELSLELGGLVGGADAHAVAELRRAGRLLGRAFQIQDDLLDLTAEGDGWGKTIGGDLVEGKKAYLALRAVERAEGDERAWLARALDGGLPAASVPEARDRMSRLGVLDDAARAVADYSARGGAALDVLPDGPAADALRALAVGLATRAA
ncbi:polyprenyl synthetase family protein [Rubrivirga sp. S365]|uniref:Polyprenyl synthetase family protein n=1 Tax=Rubrivirga litoralis TaxID=3075598 RepID=A0ABU3BTB0_9BACT|nr:MULTISPECIES: polyprenyl synthetase family protein [unclassified Rubrivirga]MDT0632533.1 polyprenyl synthetase family protein [Rubrivirga sp. F394]MDT7856998.1 polyprenyl synthetase family protein [Rubrivirga sp. S365]